MPIKVAFVQQDGLMTGSAISLLNLIQGFPKYAVQPYIIFLKDGPAIELFKKEGYDSILVQSNGFWTTPGPYWYQRDNLDNLKALIPNFRLRKEIKNIKPDLIHINDKAALNAGISSLGLKIPIVQHLRSTRYICRNILNHYISKFIVEYYSSYKISISEDEADGFRKKNFEVIFNSLDVEYFNKILTNKFKLNNSNLNVGWVGRFSKEKGAYDFLDVAGLIAQNLPNVEFHMLSPMPKDNEFESLPDGSRILRKTFISNLIKKNKLEGKIQLHGYRSDYLNVVASMDLIINCNRLGALSRQSFESLCLGVPTLATAKFPGRSSILNEDVGRVLKEGEIKEIAQTAIILLKNDPLRSEMGKRALEWGRSQFDRDKQSQKVFEIYKNLVN